MQLAKPCLQLGALLIAVAATLAVPLARPAHAADSERQITSGGIEREFILHVPDNAPPGPKPLIIALHGAWQPAGVMQRYLDLDKVADREGFVVAYPKGLNLLWNDGRATVAGIMPIIYPRDDGRFVLDVLSTLEGEGLVDPGRAYLMGFSNGGFLTAYVACRYANRFAAFATMMMTVPVGYNESCKPERPVPILMMNGTYDPIVPMFGRPTPGARLMSASESAALFARIDGCAPPEESRAPNTRILRWNKCAPGAAVAFYEIAGGHQPPAQSVGAGDALAAVLLGPRRSGLDAPEEIWSFFTRFGTPQALPPDAALVAGAGAAATGTTSFAAAAPAAPQVISTASAPVMASAVPAVARPLAAAAPASASASTPIVHNPDSFATAWQGIAPASADAPAPAAVPALHQPLTAGTPQPLAAHFVAAGEPAASAPARLALVPLPPPSPLRPRTLNAQVSAQ